MSPRLSLRRPRYADVAATLALLVATSGTAYAVTMAPPGSVGTAAIQNRAVTASKIASGAVVGRAVAPNAIVGSKVADHTLTMSDLAGANVAGAITFALSAHGCGKLLLGVAGAKVGQAAYLTWLGTTDPLPGVVLGPLKVVAAGQVAVIACNLTDGNISYSGVRIRVVTVS